MSESDSHQIVEKVDSLWRQSADLLQSSVLTRGVGYGLLLLVLFDLINLLVPLGFMNPAWELQTFGSIVERSAVPLVAMTMLFWGGLNGRFKFELPILKGLSWLALVIGLVFWLMIPMAIFSAVRIDRQNEQQVTAQVQQGKTQIQQIQTQLEQVANPSEMEKLIKQFDRSGSSPKIENTQKLEEVKQGLTSSLTQGQTNLTNQAQTLRQNQRFGLIKNSVKWNLGALVAGALFLWIWMLTNWARSKRQFSKG